MSQSVHFYTALLTLHQQLMAGDPTPLAEIAQLVLEPLARQLHRKFPDHTFPSVDDHLTMQAAADALLEYGNAPAQANATSGAGVLGFLVLRGTSRLRNALRKERVQQRAEGRYAHGLRPGPRQKSTNPVELHRVRGEHGKDPLEERAADTLPNDPAEVLDQLARRDEVLEGIEAERDRRIMEMMLDGVREASAYAEVLKITGCDLDEQRRIVKQHKDRIKAAARRRQEAKSAGPRRRGRPPRRPEDSRE